jgi:hypothetical protein
MFSWLCGKDTVLPEKKEEPVSVKPVTQNDQLYIILEFVFQSRFINLSDVRKLERVSKRMKYTVKNNFPITINGLITDAIKLRHITSFRNISINFTILNLILVEHIGFQYEKEAIVILERYLSPDKLILKDNELGSLGSHISCCKDEHLMENIFLVLRNKALSSNLNKNTIDKFYVEILQTFVQKNNIFSFDRILKVCDINFLDEVFHVLILQIFSMKREVMLRQVVDSLKEKSIEDRAVWRVFNLMDAFFKGIPKANIKVLNILFSNNITSKLLIDYIDMKRLWKEIYRSNEVINNSIGFGIEDPIEIESEEKIKKLVLDFLSNKKC